MGVRGVLTKNYFIYPETVAEYGAEIERVMTETDRAMVEVLEIIAKMASVTERIPSQIRSGELLELCETAQAEIKSFDFLSYGKRVNQGLLNLLDQNQYITENFIKKMEATTERMREFGAGCRRLTELIDYSGGSLPLKGLALSAVSNAEGRSADGEEDGEGSSREREDILPCAGVDAELNISTEEVMARSGAIILSNYMTVCEIWDENEICKFIKWISVRRSDLLQQLYISNNSSAEEVEQTIDEIFGEIVIAQDGGRYQWIYNRYQLIITVDDVESLDLGVILNQTQKETFTACWNKLVSMGLSEVQIIAVMANIYAESGCSARNAEDGKGYNDVDLVDENYVFCTDDLVAFGIIQWKIQSRKQALWDYANDTGGSVYDLETQLGYFQYEMEEGICAKKIYWGTFLEASSLDDAVDSFCENVELANPSNQELERRENYAEMINLWYQNLNN